MNKLPPNILFILFFALCGSQAFCQGRRMGGPPGGAGFHRGPNFENRMIMRQSQPAQPPKLNKIEQAKVHFFNKQLKLSSDEQDKFWPVYRNYQQELTAIYRAKRLNNSDNQPNGTEQINRDLAYDSQILEIKRKYNDAFLKILPPEKVSELYKSERVFRDELLKALSERNAQTTPPPGN
jgi:hypothetical protein